MCKRINKTLWIFCQVDLIGIIDVCKQYLIILIQPKNFPRYLLGNIYFLSYCIIIILQNYDDINNLTLFAKYI